MDEIRRNAIRMQHNIVNFHENRILELKSNIRKYNLSRKTHLVETCYKLLNRHRKQIERSSRTFVKIWGHNPNLLEQ